MPAFHFKATFYPFMNHSQQRTSLCASDNVNALRWSCYRRNMIAGPTSKLLGRRYRYWCPGYRYWCSVFQLRLSQPHWPFCLFINKTYTISKHLCPLLQLLPRDSKPCVTGGEKDCAHSLRLGSIAQIELVFLRIRRQSVSKAYNATDITSRTLRKWRFWYLICVNMDVGSLLTSEQSACQNYTSVLWAGKSIPYVVWCFGLI